MGSIDYREAFARGWWLLVVLGLVGLGVGILLPSGQPKPQWSTTSYVGANPGSLVATSPLAPGTSLAASRSNSSCQLPPEPG